jgi:hypothetical protein
VVRLAPALTRFFLGVVEEGWAGYGRLGRARGAVQHGRDKSACRRCGQSRRFAGQGFDDFFCRVVKHAVGLVAVARRVVAVKVFARKHRWWVTFSSVSHVEKYPGVEY